MVLNVRKGWTGESAFSSLFSYRAPSLVFYLFFGEKIYISEIAFLNRSKSCIIDLMCMIRQISVTRRNW